MGVQLGDLVEGIAKEVEPTVLKGKKVSIDAYNALYQFLAAIRQPDGTPLLDSKGRVTSHLSGVFYRTINLIEEGITPVYVFDGTPPEEKAKEIERRRKAKEEATKRLQQAKELGESNLKKYAQATTRLTNEMAEEAERLLKAMGVPVVQAPSEGEAEAAYLNKLGLTWAAVSQDYDSILFGAKRLVRNLAVTGKRKLPNKDVYVEIKPEIIESDELMRKLGLTLDQLIDVAILIGTDYDPDGVKGIGPKTALNIIKRYGDLKKAIEKGAVPRQEVDFDVDRIRELFKNPKVVKPDFSLELGKPNPDEILEILVKEHDFNETRISNAIERLVKASQEAKGASRQTGLDQWF
ncbi:MAG: flap endonuclease-1 [Sulfolobales archaeon]|nr:flap endonuclease-1 [Sulfolobales archaeon]